MPKLHLPRWEIRPTPRNRARTRPTLRRRLAAGWDRGGGWHRLWPRRRRRRAIPGRSSNKSWLSMLDSTLLRTHYNTKLRYIYSYRSKLFCVNRFGSRLSLELMSFLDLYFCPACLEYSVILSIEVIMRKLFNSFTHSFLTTGRHCNLSIACLLYCIL